MKTSQPWTRLAIMAASFALVSALVLATTIEITRIEAKAKELDSRVQIVEGETETCRKYGDKRICEWPIKQVLEEKCGFGYHHGDCHLIYIETCDAFGCYKDKRK